MRTLTHPLIRRTINQLGLVLVSCGAHASSLPQCGWWSRGIGKDGHSERRDEGVGGGRPPTDASQEEGLCESEQEGKEFNRVTFEPNGHLL